jgi:flagellar protein FliS
MTPYGRPNAYRESAIMTASPEQLVVMLYDGAVRFLRQAEAAMGEGAWQHAFERLSRAEAIIDELLATLDMSQGEIAERLQAIYVFCKKLLIQARIERQAAKVGQVIPLLTELREAWAKIASGATAEVPAR